MWDVAPEQFGETPETTNELVDATLAQARPGSIILLHPWYGRTQTRDAIGPIIDGLQERGYRFVTVSELID